MGFLKNTKNFILKKIFLPFNRFQILDSIQLLAFFALLLIVFYTGRSTLLAVFSERDIARAVGWLNGSFYWPGPEMSGGNNLPGPFFYFLLFPALLMGENIYSQVILWAIIWSALIYTLTFFFIKKMISHKESLLTVLITFTLININSQNYTIMLNAEFAVLFHVLALIGLYFWRDKKNSFYLYLTGLVIALGIQAHLLTAIHILTVLLFYTIDKLKGEGGEKKYTLLLFLISALSPILIYNALKSFQVFETTGRHYDEHIKTTLTSIFSENWLNNIKELISFVFPVSFCLIYTLWRKRKTKKSPLKSSTKNLLIIVITPIPFLLLVARTHWYLLFVPIFFIILISKWLDDLMPDKINKKVLFLLSYCFFTAFCILTLNWTYTNDLHFYRLFSIEKKFLYSFLLTFFIIVITSLQWNKATFYKSAGLCLLMLIPIGILSAFPKHQRAIQKTFHSAYPSKKALYPLMKKIYLETNWTPTTAMKKIFNIGVHPGRSLLTDYAMIVETLNSQDKLKPLTKDKRQGYFIIQHLKKFSNWTQKEWSSYLSKSSLLFYFGQQEIKAGHIIIQNPKLYGNFWLIPYSATKHSLFPEGFHNIGQAYYWEEPEWLKTCNQTQKYKTEQPPPIRWGVQSLSIGN